MTTNETIYLFEGYLLLPLSSSAKYRGVDRNPFTPSLIMEETDPLFTPQKGDPRIWVWYPKGWRREAYRLYEEDTVEGTKENLSYLLANFATARSIQKTIEPHLGTHEIVRCRILSLTTLQSETETMTSKSLGYDVAYLGGDFYSAVKNGLVVNSEPQLSKEYKQFLNEFGLFSMTSAIPQYVKRFRELVKSEAASEFYVYALGLENA